MSTKHQPVLISTRLSNRHILGGILLGVFAALLILAALCNQPAAASAASGLPFPQAPRAAVNACGSLPASATWTADNVYIANNCDIVIPQGITLTLQAGTVVKFSGGAAALIVRGALLAQGSAAQPVVITSLNDNAHAGAAEGSTGSPAAGDWYGLHFFPDSRADIQHAFIGYGASGAWNGVIGKWNGAHLYVESKRFNMQHVQITQGKMHAILFTGNGLAPTLNDLSISNHLSGDAWKPAYGVLQASPNMTPTYSSLSFAANDVNMVGININPPGMTQDVTLGGAQFTFTCGYTLCILYVPNGKTLTFAPGTLLHLTASYGITVNSGGAMIAEGTPTQPITFTNITQPATAEGHWVGLRVLEGGSLRMAHADISYAVNSNYGAGALEIDAADVQVAHTRLHHNWDDGLVFWGRSANIFDPYFNQLTIDHNGGRGVYFIHGGGVFAPLIENSVIHDNGKTGVFYWSSIGQVNPTLRNVIIRNNGFAGADANSRSGIALGYRNVSPTLEDVSLLGNAGPAIFYQADGSITARRLIASGNGSDVLSTSGSVYDARSWQLAQAGIPIHVNGLSIEPGAMLSIQPGTTLRFAASKTLNISNASLFALGEPEAPITFTGQTGTPGDWTGIYLNYTSGAPSTIVLRNCDISNAFKAVQLWGTTATPADTVIIQNCRIHDNSDLGLRNNFLYPVIRGNSFTGNPTAVNGEGAVQTDVRGNWWGDASGPYNAANNPAGAGDPVTGNVLFDPWLQAPPDALQGGLDWVLVETGAPKFVSPGQVADYAVQYYNLMTTTLQNAVVVVQLPQAAEFVSAAAGGKYWPERDQVFWTLGDLPAGANGLLSFQVRFMWGLPRNYSDSTITLFSADNYQAANLDRTSYLAYQPVSNAVQSLLTPAEFTAQRNAIPALQAAYNAALADGFTYHSAAYIQRSDGATVLEGLLVKAAQQKARILSHHAGNVLVYEISPTQVSVYNQSGGADLNLDTGVQTTWGDWSVDATKQTLFAPSGCDSKSCTRNCRLQMLGWAYIGKKAARVVGWTALSIFTGGAGVPGAIWEVGSTLVEFHACSVDCTANPLKHCCEAGMVKWTNSFFNKMGNTCMKWICNATTGLWKPDGTKTCIAYGQRCVAGVGGPGCTDCEEKNTAADARLVDTLSAAPCVADASGKPRCRDLQLFVAKDPNALYGPAGDLQPGQWVTYTITYENEGQGRAYGVYVTSNLLDVFDAASLRLPGGVYLPGERQMAWLVGELGPNGDADSTGAITFTVQLKQGLPSGTPVNVQAVVYFPSVPEETPTNAWVNLVAPLAALPQDLQTNYTTALNITLTGREASGLPLTFKVLEQPAGGTLGGAAPHLTYTPAANFTGWDGFTFQVSNTITTSRPAQVRILVLPSGDKTAPQVLWVTPAAGAQDVESAAAPLYTDALGPAYLPLISLGFSEAIDEASLTGATVQLLDPSGKPVPVILRPDGLLRQVQIAPQQALQGNKKYTLRVTTGVKDQAGNPLGAAFESQFTTRLALLPLYLPLIKR